MPAGNILVSANISTGSSLQGQMPLEPNPELFGQANTFTDSSGFANFTKLVASVAPGDYRLEFTLDDNNQVPLHPLIVTTKSNSCSGDDYRNADATRALSKFVVGLAVNVLQEQTSCVSLKVVCMEVCGVHDRCMFHVIVLRKGPIKHVYGTLIRRDNSLVKPAKLTWQ